MPIRYASSTEAFRSSRNVSESGILVVAAEEREGHIALLCSIQFVKKPDVGFAIQARAACMKGASSKDFKPAE